MRLILIFLLLVIFASLQLDAIRRILPQAKPWLVVRLYAEPWGLPDSLTIFDIFSSTDSIKVFFESIVEQSDLYLFWLVARFPAALRSY